MLFELTNTVIVNSTNITTNIETAALSRFGYGWVVDGMVGERVPLFHALIRNFPALLRRAQSSTTPPCSVIKESARKPDGRNCLGDKAQLTKNIADRTQEDMCNFAFAFYLILTRKYSHPA